MTEMWPKKAFHRGPAGDSSQPQDLSLGSKPKDQMKCGSDATAAAVAAAATLQVTIAVLCTCADVRSLLGCSQ